MKRYESLINHEKANETWAIYEAEELAYSVHHEHRRGVLPPEIYYALLEEMEEAKHREYEATSRVCRAEVNLRRAHVALCRVRMTTPKEKLLEGLSLLESVEGAELSLAPPLELIANSLTSHAPPIELDSKSGTGSS
jgi:hypothetical protein